ncbi:hypothetical protein K440DRAFT_146715 [Wilcoxina mikolae CBS 423.85]|nr:hypothetical protein K440DRAFT_146715 [Wilcoxina mikolae CBS 423.85]
MLRAGDSLKIETQQTENLPDCAFCPSGPAQQQRSETTMLSPFPVHHGASRTTLVVLEQRMRPHWHLAWHFENSLSVSVWFFFVLTPQFFVSWLLGLFVIRFSANPALSR